MSNAWIPFGRFVRAHGVRGELRLRPHEAGARLPATVRRVLVGEGAGAVEHRLLRARTGGDAVLVTLEGIADRDAAQACAGREVWVARQDLPPLAAGEFYLHELVEARAVDDAERELGVIEGLQTVGGRDLLLLRTPLGQRLVPLLDDTVVRWDPSARRAVLHIVGGLLDE